MGHAGKNGVQFVCLLFFFGGGGGGGGGGMGVGTGMEAYGNHAATAAANNQHLGGSPEGEDVIANIKYK